MKRIATASILLMMTASLATANIAAAQPQHNDNRAPAARHDDRRDDRDNRGWHKKSDFRKGGHVAYNDWQRGRSVDYRKVRGLSKPPKGYEWRKVDNRYILAAAATGIITAIILSH
ncbi:RcnB family protein [Asticcacaulis sp. BYS171W]|uniref:RcnB family protein n=1 Tax=Asticcacaulis aquaticus TaxID=2984212 RepID=A0ABT5HV38_9CAUL|nr:RcnB family protein [Asticcacaulis aquaticus]MDC7683940.1 RcnB family protein [Asticcacaulis aquaticus]